MEVHIGVKAQKLFQYLKYEYTYAKLPFVIIRSCYLTKRVGDRAGE